jgi:hypothetical protein
LLLRLSERLNMLDSRLETTWRFSLVVVLMLTLVAVAVVAFLLWRRSDDWMALLVGLMLLSFGPSSFTNTVLLSRWLGSALATHLLSVSEPST